jgi:iron-sulfur cluster repair protein YtfE (RIC family)
LTWLQKKAAAVQFFESDLALHFKAEEESLFPAMRDWPDASRLISELLNEHRELERSIEQLRGSRDASLAERLNEFADLLEAHIRKEERILFPLYEQQVPSEIASQVRQGIIDTIGHALQPRHPELLR